MITAKSPADARQIQTFQDYIDWGVACNLAINNILSQNNNNENAQLINSLRDNVYCGQSKMNYNLRKKWNTFCKNEQNIQMAQEHMVQTSVAGNRLVAVHPPEIAIRIAEKVLREHGGKPVEMSTAQRNAFIVNEILPSLEQRVLNINSIQEQNAELIQHNRDMTEQINNINTQIANLQIEKSSLQTENNKLRINMHSLHEDITSKQLQLDELRTEIEVLNLEITESRFKFERIKHLSEQLATETGIKVVMPATPTKSGDNNFMINNDISNTNNDDDLESIANSNLNNDNDVGSIATEHNRSNE